MTPRNGRRASIQNVITSSSHGRQDREHQRCRLAVGQCRHDAGADDVLIGRNGGSSGIRDGLEGFGEIVGELLRSGLACLGRDADIEVPERTVDLGDRPTPSCPKSSRRARAR